MKQVFIKKGEAIIENVPAPLVTEDEILVQVYYSCISIGTEMFKIQASGRPLYKKIMDKPQNIRKVLGRLKNHGLRDAIVKVKSKIEGKNPIGYSASGIVLETGKNIKNFKPGDRVACAGDKIANHAEFIAVPENLAVKIPQNLSVKAASTVTLGSISLQGVRRCSPTLGENIVVIGLGILGQLTLQMLKVAGCHVIGIDLEKSRIEKAIKLGLDAGFSPDKVNVVEEVIRNTDGFGADAAIITAASKGSEVINQAMEMCRKKGKVIVVGDVNLNIKREEFYKKELDLLISTSYGPGRYDERYEQKGVDYPYAYVRWTENRNMQEYLKLLSENKIEIEPLIERIYKVEEVSKAYEELKSISEKPLIVLLEYNRESKPDVKVVINKFKAVHDRINVGVIGAGNFTKSVHLPNLQKLDKVYRIVAICSKTGGNAESTAEQYNASYATTDYKKLLEDKNIDMVLIATRHNLHVKIAIDAAESGKAIFVEKPMALNEEELGRLVKILKKTKVPFVVGFNRRFSPFAVKIKEIVSKRVNPMIISYRMNAGYIPKEHWVHSIEGGGRNIGEACHVYDLFNYLIESRFLSVDAVSIKPTTEQFVSNDNFTATIKYEDGSVCNLIYTALGTKSVPKERMEIYVDNKVIYLDDYKDLKIFGSQEKGLKRKVQDKGQYNELLRFSECLKSGSDLIPLWQLVQATKISFEVEDQIS
ncbi:Inositol 2-dehydrogenase/D-chiro-inositol 3-dehydrogenase [subsurface metagenome]|nr:zinc-binding dehydrogenase [Clostridia bacterium]